MTNTPTLLDAAITIASQAHAGQRRKYVNTPYLSHCLEVVNILIEHGIDDQVMLAAAALHDVLEDCEGWKADTLRWKLFEMPRYKHSPTTTVALVQELTEPAHQGNRATRKALECERLSKISADAQTIKYADLISNTGSIVQHDVGFAKVYLQEKWNILGVMAGGDAVLFTRAVMTCKDAADDMGLVLT